MATGQMALSVRARRVWLFLLAYRLMVFCVHFGLLTEPQGDAILERAQHWIIVEYREYRPGRKGGRWRRAEWGCVCDGR